MVTTAIPLAAGLACLALLLGSLVGAAAGGSLPRNAMVGIRTRATKASDAAWSAGHRAAAPVLKASVAVAVVFAVVTLAAGTLSDDWAFAVGMTGMAATVALLLVATARANSAARDAG